MTNFPIGLVIMSLSLGTLFGSTMVEWKFQRQCDKVKVVIVSGDVYKCEKQKGDTK